MSGRRAGWGSMATLKRGRWMRVLAIVLAGLLTIYGCGSPSLTPSPSGAPSPLPATSAPNPTSTSPGQASPEPSVDPLLNAQVVTVSDRLRVRSLPEVSDASIKYEPLLPLGTELHVIGGPAEGSGYIWYEVRPVAFELDGGVEQGWVALASKDGEAWIAPINAPIAGLETAMSAVPRTRASASDAASMGESVTAFGVDLYTALETLPEVQGQNLVFSPTSIAMALGLARLGAKGETGAQIDDVLHVAGQAELQAGLNGLDQELASREGTYPWDDGKLRELKLRLANASFGQRGWSIEQVYLDAIASAFGAGLNLVDYAADPEAARQVINSWVSQRTNHRIPELLREPDVSDLTRFYLVNAVYMKANWFAQFEVDQTRPRPFARIDGSEVTVPTMWLGGEQEVPYLEGRGWRATELRYRGPTNTAPLAMMLIRPDDVASFERAMTGDFFDALGSDLTAERARLSEVTPGSTEDSCGTYPYSVELFMPKFSLETRAKLNGPLGTLGIRDAFVRGLADFTGIHVPEGEGDEVVISQVIHQANIDVDEVGTEAAAATAVGMDTTGGCGGPAPAEVVEFRLDRPFLFAIRDIETGAILFMGRVVDPSVER